MTRHFLRDDDLTPAEQAEVLALASAAEGRAGTPRRRWRARRPSAIIFDKPTLRTQASFTAGDRRARRLPDGRRRQPRADRRPRVDRRHRPGARPAGRRRSCGGPSARSGSRRWRRTPASRSSTRSPTSSTPASCSPTCRPSTSTRARSPACTVAFLGDAAYNMAHSFLLAGATAGMHVRVSGPAGFAPDPAVLARAPARSPTRRAARRHYVAGPGRGGHRRRRRRHRHLGVDGQGGRGRRAQPSRSGPTPLDARRCWPRRSPTRSCCTACRPTAARRSPPTSSTARRASSGTRPRTGCTPRRRC